MDATMKSPSEDKLKALATTLQLIEQAEGKGTIMDMSAPPLPIAAISTGALPLDIALGVGGIPRGRLAEIYGPESSGKTTLCYHLIAEAQRAGGIAAFIDAENSMDVAYAARCGVNIKDLIVSQPDYGEQALRVCEQLVCSDAVDIVLVDSIAALVPKAEVEGEIGDSHMGLQARMMSQALRKIASEANKHDCTVMFTNQLREKIGVMFGSPETTPGGRAMRFYASVRLDIRRIATLKNGTEAYGNRVKVEVKKNKVAPPFRKCEFDIIYGTGVDTFGSLIDLGVEIKSITKSGSHLSYGETKLGNGKPASIAFLRENPEIAGKIDGEIRAKFLGSNEIDATLTIGESAEKPGEIVDPLVEQAREQAQELAEEKAAA
jgi:recombination protein RecA